jgi:GNAT superfamily N-acetyltransferase
MLLRMASPAEAPVLAQAWYGMIAESVYVPRSSPEGWAERLAAHFSAEIARGRSAWFVVEEDGAIVSTAAAFLPTSFWAEIFDEAPIALIAGVYTWPPYRERGYARQTVEAAIEWCRAQEVKTIRLRASDAARTMYESLGFVTSDEMELNLDRTDATV